MLQTDVEDREVIEEWLSSRRKQKVHILVPKKGTKEKLVELARENARMVLDKDRERIRREEGRTIGAVHEVEEWLGLKDIVRMEAFDISNISGFESLGASLPRDRMITPAWKKCLPDVLLMRAMENLTALPECRICF